MKKLLIYVMIAACAMVVAEPTRAALVDTRTQAFSPTIKTIKLALESNPYFPSVITMGTDDRMHVTFDELGYEHRFLRYSLVHCDANWQPSDLVDSEFVDGFNYADITDYAYSAGVFTHYVHYDFALPNEDMRILLSGNYLVKVYPDDDPDNVLLQARFSVCENTMMVMPSVTSRTDIDYNSEHQQLSIEMRMKEGKIRDPYSDLKVTVTQNSRMDNEVRLSAPLSVNGDRVRYEHQKSLIFPAGNEFRRIETISINTPSMGVARMEYHEPFYHATLVTDEPRCNTQYLYDQTQNGRFTIRNWDTDNPTTEADYIITHFTLDAGGPLTGGKLYVDGEFTQHLYGTENLMKYDIATGLYSTAMMLKQGAYNYQYLWIPDGASVGQTSKVEGDKYQTVNEYAVKVYYREPGARYDKLIGFAVVFSGE